MCAYTHRERFATDCPQNLNARRADAVRGVRGRHSFTTAANRLRTRRRSDERLQTLLGD